MGSLAYGWLLETERCGLAELGSLYACGRPCLRGRAWAVEGRRPFRLDVQSTEQGPRKATGGSQMNLPALTSCWGEGRKQCSQKNLIVLLLLGEEVPTSVCYWKSSTPIGLLRHTQRFLRTAWLNLCNSDFSAYLRLLWTISRRHSPSFLLPCNEGLIRSWNYLIGSENQIRGSFIGMVQLSGL